MLEVAWLKPAPPHIVVGRRDSCVNEELSCSGAPSTAPARFPEGSGRNLPPEHLVTHNAFGLQLPVLLLTRHSLIRKVFEQQHTSDLEVTVTGWDCVPNSKSVLGRTQAYLLKG